MKKYLYIAAGIILSPVILLVFLIVEISFVICDLADRFVNYIFDKYVY